MGYTRLLLTHPPTLTPDDLHDALLNIMELLETQGDVDTVTSVYVKIASFLSALRTTGLDHKADYIAEAVRAILNYSSVVDPESLTSSSKIVVDIVGTGGDNQNTFNVSTSSAIVASGIPGLKVCKHGGKATTSNSGAGDLITTLGCDVSMVNAVTVPNMWHSNSFLFLLAPYFHGGMSRVAKLRRMLSIPTIFNILGPLLHPVAVVDKRVLGVYSQELGEEYAKAAAMVYPTSETFVVWGHVGLDEVSPVGKTTIWYVNPNLKNSSIETFEVEPSMFGLKEHPLSECISLGPKGNAEILRDKILNGHCKLGDNDHYYDFILLNTAVLYCLSQGHRSWKQGVRAADESIQSGRARDALNHFISDTRNL